MGEFIDNHPFIIVAVCSFIFMLVLNKSSMNMSKHSKHLKEIEERKKRKALKS